MAGQKHGARPIPVEETPGRKAYCTCGWSEELPYCDGTHHSMAPGCRPIVVEVAEAGKKWICQCHRSGNMPWCDGKHKDAKPAEE
ncbi:MAG: CDGSH iron-sulfur domain-containing protein [Phycisphaerae bacterium]|nr:CDGSH iron-sulfur domain-containing protein [Phycisphaerae bacterium]